MHYNVEKIFSAWYFEPMKNSIQHGLLIQLLIYFQSMWRANRGTVSGYFLAGRYMTWLPVSYYRQFSYLNFILRRYLNPIYLYSKYCIVSCYFSLWKIRCLHLSDRLVLQQNVFYFGQFSVGW